MKKNIKSTDKLSEGTLHEILLDIKYRLDHIEDIQADNRSIMVKMVKQSNSIVKFLASLELEELQDEKLMFDSNPLSETGSRIESLKDLIDRFMDKAKDLKELEEELKKNKDQINPGQIGES